MLAGRISKEQRARIDAAVLAALGTTPLGHDDIVARVQRSTFPLTVGWSEISLENTVTKWVRAALTRLVSKGRIRKEKVGRIAAYSIRDIS